MKRTQLLLIALFITYFSKSQGIYDNMVFDEYIKTIQSRSLVPLGGKVVLNFDYIGGDAPYMLAKILHCDWDWKPSGLMEVEYMNEFNEFQINDVEGSSSGNVPYYHYRLELPSVKLSGNYILHVYDEDNPKKNYLTRRFSVYEKSIVIGGGKSLTNVVRNRYSNQQINFIIQYGQYEIQDPYSSLHVVLRQNGRWDNAKIDLKPSFIGLGENRLEYNFFNGENAFPALREYRIFDIDRIRFWVDNWEQNNEVDNYFLREDINMSIMNYVDEVDNNGKFNISSPYDADYANVHFTLKTSKLEEDVFVFGQMSEWKLDEQFKMDYDSSSQTYKATILLKQGEYNYNYAVDRSGEADESYFQGSHSETENDYDILIYHRPFGKYYDKLIGFKRFK